MREFARKYDLSLESLQYFIHDFGIDLNFCFTDKYAISRDFESFVIKHLDFIRKYAEDKGQVKTVEMIAETIQVDKQKVADFFIQNGVNKADLPNIKTNISSYQIHLMMGGKYDFIFKDLPEHRFETNALIGYADLFFYSLDMLDPFINEDQIKLWGISKPAGIILYGPPGSGKIFWAKRIADMIGYEFVHVYKDYLLQTTHTDGRNLNSFLKKLMEQPKKLLFIENFESLWDEDNKLFSTPETMELVNTIIRYLQNNTKRELVIVGSVEMLSRLGDEITAPGRFDLHIPIFLPSSEERNLLIHYHLTNDLVQDSPLLAILKSNNADRPEYWAGVSTEMRLFSNTMLIDFTQALKKRLYAQYRRKNQTDISINHPLLFACLNEARAKLTEDYLKSCHVFIHEAKQNVAMEFPQRFMEMEYEFDSYMKKEEPIRKIGFETSAERNRNQE